MVKNIGYRLLLLLAVCALLAGTAGAETLTYRGVKADSDAETLDMGKVNVQNWEAFYGFLDGFTRLKKVDMFATYVNPKTVEELHRRYPEIEFGLTLRVGTHRVRTDATAFSTLYYEGDKTCGYEQVAQVKYCKNLYALDVGHNRIKNLDFLYEMPQLRVLIVALCDLTDITPIASLEHLEYLEIFHNRITDVSCLAGLKNLKDLNLVRNEVSDLSALAELTSLKRLWIHECNRKKPSEPDAETVAMLRAALPDCVVDADSTSTGGGWRKHPHYDVINRMFHRGVYEPFEDSDPANLPEGYLTQQAEGE